MERWLTADRYNVVGSGAVWPDLDARRIEAVTPSVGFLPDRVKSDRADIFRLTIEPGQTITYVAELASDRFARIHLWKALEYEQKSRDRQLFNGILLGITGILAVFLTAVFAANHKIIFPAAALVTWCVLALLCVDFGFWHKLFQMRPEENAQYRAAAEASVAAGLVIFLFTFLRVNLWHGFARMLFAVWIVAQLAIVATAVLDPRLAATVARLTLPAIGVVGGLLTLFLAMRGLDRALAILPTWILFLVWLFGAGVTVTGRLAGEVPVVGLLAGLVFIVVLIGFTVTQFAFRSIEPLYGASPTEQQLRSAAIESAGVAVWEWTGRRNEIRVDPAVEATLGLNGGVLSTKIENFLTYLHPADKERFQLMLQSAAAKEQSNLRLQFRIRHADSTYRWFEVEGASVPTSDRRSVRCVGLLRDVTDDKRAQERLMHDAVHDSLTGLPNRELFLDRLGVALVRAKTESDVRPVVIYCDLDKFKSVNSSFGLVVGDSLLLTVSRAAVAHICRRRTRSRAWAATSSPCFSPRPQEPRELARLAERVRQSLRSPIRIAGQEIVLTSSIGVAVYDGSQAAAHDLMREAELAMSRAKRNGSDRVEIFKPEMHADKDQRIAIESELRRAIEAAPAPRPLSAHHCALDGGVGRLRSLGALGAPEARLLEPDGIRADRRGNGPDRQAGLVRARARRGRYRALAEGAAASRRAAVHKRQCVEQTAHHARSRSRDPTCDRPQLPGAGLAATRGDGKPGHGEPRAGDAHARAAEGCWSGPRARRFRLGLFVIVLSAALPLRHHQDRPLARARKRWRGTRLGHRPLRGRARPRARQEGGG